MSLLATAPEGVVGRRHDEAPAGFPQSSSGRSVARPLRICMVVHSYYPVGEPRVQREARAACEAGHEVCVISLRRPTEPAWEVVDGIQIIRLPLQHVRGASLSHILREYGSFTLFAAREIFRLHRRAAWDIVHVHAPPDFLVAAGALPRLGGSRLILDIHDLSPHMFGARFAGLKGRLIGGGLRLIERAACAFADRVITVHEPYRRQLAADGVALGRVAVVMNSVDEALLEQVSNEDASCPTRNGDFTVAYHGTITHWYGVDLVVRAVAALHDEIPIRALILGGGDALESARDLANDLGVADACTFSGGYVPIEDALAAVSGAQCGIVPNRRSQLNQFALSSKLFEYVALGMPVAVSRLATLSAHFGWDEVTFFEPDDASSLAKALRWIATHPDEARTKAQRARQRADEYAWRTNRARFLDLVESLEPAARRVAA